MVLLATVLLLVVLFIAGLINIFFYIPTNKIRACLQIFFPNNNNAFFTNKTKTNSIAATTRTKVDKEELRKVFSTFDKNGDGFITKEELRESLRNIRIFMSDKEVDDIVVKFDSNGDGLLDFDEFCLLTSESMSMGRRRRRGGEEGELLEKEGILEEEEEEEVDEFNYLKEAFDVFDKDKDGVISVEELALVLNTLGLREGNKIEECKEMIKKVDMDGDGMVNFNEFKRMMMDNRGKLLFTA